MRVLTVDADGYPAGTRPMREALYYVSRGWARWSTLRDAVAMVRAAAERASPEIADALHEVADAMEVDVTTADNPPVLILLDSRPSEELRRRRLERAVNRSRMRDLAGWAPQETDAVRRFRLGAAVGGEEWPDVLRAVRAGQEELRRSQTARQMAARR